MKDIICDCCGSGDTSSSLEKIEQYEKKLLVTHCYSCDLSFYKEPDKPVSKKIKCRKQRKQFTEQSAKDFADKVNSASRTVEKSHK